MHARKEDGKPGAFKDVPEEAARNPVLSNLRPCVCDFSLFWNKKWKAHAALLPNAAHTPSRGGGGAARPVTFPTDSVSLGE